jgi:hypothetical protein
MRAREIKEGRPVWQWTPSSLLSYFSLPLPLGAFSVRPATGYGSAIRILHLLSLPLGALSFDCQLGIQ